MSQSYAVPGFGLETTTSRTFEEGVIELSKGERGDIPGGKIDVVSISFRLPS